MSAEQQRPSQQEVSRPMATTTTLEPQDKQTDDELIVRALVIGCVLSIVALSIYITIKNRSSLVLYEFWPLFGTASTVILLGMFGLYIYAYKFYQDNFYLFLSASWLANAIYLFFETFFNQHIGSIWFVSAIYHSFNTVHIISSEFPTLPETASPEYILTFRLKVYVIGAITSLPFYIASFIPVNNVTNYRKLFFSVGKWLAWLAVTFAICYWSVKSQYPQINAEYKLLFFLINGIIFSAWSLKRVGDSLKARLSRDVHKRWAVIFPMTFYAYAGFQPLYLTTMLHSDVIKRILFTSTFITKIINSISALNIIRLDAAEVQKQLEQRSVLEDLGALTASIEHDIKNPLEVIDKELKNMRNRFQANSDIMAFCKRLDEQRLRIFATTQVIPILRGQRDYYERFMERTNIRDLINSSIRAVKKEMNTHNIGFKTESVTVENKLYVKAYRPMLEQAIVNILRNAVEAIQEANRENGNINIDIRLNKKAEEGENAVRVDFRDNGCGIREENLPDVMKLFMTTRSDKKPNSGIGLFITQRILKVHEGTLVIRNNEDEGVTVSIFLPQWTDKYKRSSKQSN